MKTRIVTILGARPQFIKASVVSRELRKDPDVTEVMVHTGQHYDNEMSDVFFRELGIPPPAANLGIGSSSHGVQTGRMLAASEEVLLEHKPDWLLVYGDTNSTMAAALAAAKLHVPVAHVEAGLRLYDLSIPEEVNRLVTDQLARMNFTPTTQATANLLREGLPHARIAEVGDVMYDVALSFGEQAAQQSTVLDSLGLRGGDYVLATVHRAHNTDDLARLKAIFEGLEATAQHLRVICPLHPRTRHALDRCGYTPKGITLIKPVGYLDMLMLEKSARLIVTDSGGVQKEAFFYRVHCVTLMGETPWVELATMGWNHMVEPVSGAAVRDGIAAALSASPGIEGQPYGEGRAAQKIAAALAGGR